MYSFNLFIIVDNEKTNFVFNNSFRMENKPYNVVG